MKKLITTIAILTVVFSSYYVYIKNKAKQPLLPVQNAVANTITHTFENLGITLDIPADLDVTIDPIKNIADPSKLDNYIFYIQHWKNPSKEGSSDFQIYGMYQFDLPKTTWENFSLMKTDTATYAYMNEIEVNGLMGLESQFRGERNNYTYQFLLDGRTLRFTVSPATEENKVFADKIIKTLKVVGKVNPLTIN